MITEEVKEGIKKLILGITEIPEKDLVPEAKFVEDLGVDSMMALEIVASIEKKYKIKIPESEIPKANTLNAIYELIDENNK